MYWGTGIAGLLLIVAPFVFNYSANQNALWTSVILGAIALVVSIWEGYVKDDGRWEYTTTGIAGILAIVAPWVLGFNTQDAPTWTNIVLGLVLAALSGWELFREKPATRVT